METKIYKLSEEDYDALAAEVKSKLMSPCYFTGVVEAVGREDVILRLTASIIIYRRRPDSRNTYDRHDPISHTSVVWWDFVCEGEEGIICDDFDFAKFTTFLIEEE